MKTKQSNNSVATTDAVKIANQRALQPFNLEWENDTVFKKRELNYKTKVAFQKDLEAGKISKYTTVFIKDTKEIYKNGQYYGGASGGGSGTGVGKVDSNSDGTGEVFNNYDGEDLNISKGNSSHAEGKKTQANGNGSHAEGIGTITGDSSNPGIGIGAHAEGVQTQAIGNYSHAEGYNCIAEGTYSHSEGESTQATNSGSHAEGRSTKASGNGSHSEGSNTIAKGNYSHAEGQYTQANGNYSHAEGHSTEANGIYSHAEGHNTEATGECSHAEGLSSGGGLYYLKASGGGSHAEGYVSLTTGGGIEASGKGSHAEGFNIFENCKMIAQGDGSHIQNVGTVAKNYGQTSMGCFNEDDETPKPTSYDASKPALIIGNGTSSAAGNAFKVLFNGKTFADGEYSGAGADYAEMFEWKDGNPNNEDRVGRFVTLENDKIRLAKFTDSYILGIVSGAPTIIGDNPMRWQGKYLNDEWGRVIIEDVEVKYFENEEYIDENNIKSIRKVEKTRIDRVPKLNPDYNNKLDYLLRTERKEWDAVGLLGKLLVRQDGTLKVGEYCKPNDNGIATNSDSGYIVMKVINEKQALVLFK